LGYREGLILYRWPLKASGEVENEDEGTAFWQTGVQVEKAKAKRSPAVSDPKEEEAKAVSDLTAELIPPQLLLTYHRAPPIGFCLKLGLFGIVKVYNPNSWFTITMTRIVGKICKNTREIKKTTSGALRAFVFSIFPSVFADVGNNPSHWDGNPGIGIVNLYNPKQSQLQAEACISSPFGGDGSDV